MALIKCLECGNEISDKASSCPNCGYSIARQRVKQNVNDKKSSTGLLKLIKNFFIIFSLICFVLSGIFYYKSYDVKNEYYNSENYPRLNKNAYVGGDAYNYIINGTYFTGYAVIASAALLSGMLLITNSVILAIKIKELK